MLEPTVINRIRHIFLHQRAQSAFLRRRTSLAGLMRR